MLLWKSLRRPAFQSLFTLSKAGAAIVNTISSYKNTALTRKSARALGGFSDFSLGRFVRTILETELQYPANKGSSCFHISFPCLLSLFPFLVFFSREEPSRRLKKKSVP